MSPILKSSLFSAALVSVLAASEREARAQATYVGTFALTNGASVKCLTSEENSLAGNFVVRSPWAAIPAQEWAFFLLPNGFYAIMNVQNTLFIRNAHGGLGTFLIDQSAWTANLNQMWYLYPLGNHFYALVNVGSGEMLTDPNTSSANGTRVEGDPWTDNLNQWWYLYFLRK
jgi:Ricin-type beta-trefoil lectin domain-like